MPTIHILAEGYTEIKLLSVLKDNIKLAKVHTSQFNCWNHSIEKRLIKLTKNGKTTIFIVFDIDILNKVGTNIQASIQKFQNNITILLNSGYHVILLQQTENFEDELARAINQKKISLFNHFNVNNADEFKTAFLNCNNILVRLEQLGFNETRLWTQTIEPKIAHIPRKKCVHGSWEDIKK